MFKTLEKTENKNKVITLNNINEFPLSKKNKRIILFHKITFIILLIFSIFFVNVYKNANQKSYNSVSELHQKIKENHIQTQYFRKMLKISKNEYRLIPIDNRLIKINKIDQIDFKRIIFNEEENLIQINNSFKYFNPDLEPKIQEINVRLINNEELFKDNNILNSEEFLNFIETTDLSILDDNVKNYSLFFIKYNQSLNTLDYYIPHNFFLELKNKPFLLQEFISYITTRENNVWIKGELALKNNN